MPINAEAPLEALIRSANNDQIASQRPIDAVLYYSYHFPTIVYAPESIC